MKKVYGRIIITTLADEKLINDTEGILYSEFDVLANEIDRVVVRWNSRKSKNKLTVIMSEEGES